ncbi:MAG: sulfatase [Verrucomicrobiales bacterium]|nr:sulfatase [Verrucomicrobiales bacterium]|tara:strand:+ start:8634 stop:10055 length:1422 start_codon:yes stop_codon:yes gene_type:complete
MNSNPLLNQTRRQFFQDCGVGVGKIALASTMAGRSIANQTSPIAPKRHHHTPKVKNVIFLFQAGAPSQLELFDHKPKLAELEGKPIPPSVIQGQRYAFIQPDAAVLGPRFKFTRHGQSGAELSEMLPHLGAIADEIAVLKGCTTDQFNHAPAQLFYNTGFGVPGRPAMGSWLSYGLGSEANDLPSFVVLKSAGNLSGGAALWSSGFLPTTHVGVPFRSTGDPILNVANPAGYDQKAQRDTLDLIGKMNRRRLGLVGDPEIETRINSYEMAYRMQTRAPELMDLKGESEHTLTMYGASRNGSGSYANNCLLARRLIERGVRFVQVYHAGWDHHSNVEGGVRGQARLTDRSSAALIKDLKMRGMLDETLVVWSGEFGRTPMVESNSALGRKLGRDHHPQAFTCWMAGGGIKPGTVIGATDELGFHVVEDKVHVHDIQATILHLLGLDHERLIYTFQGRPYRLTDVHGHLVKKILA